MSAPFLRPLGLVVLVACAPLAQAEEPSGELIGLKLRPEAALRPYSPPGDLPLPVYVEADRIEGNSEQAIELTGEVELRRRGQAVFADWMLYDVPDEEVYAIGNVRLYQRGNVLQGTKARINLDKDVGFVDEPRYSIAQTGGYGEGTRLNLEGPGLLTFENANYTTCGPSSQDWVFESRTLSLDRDAETGVARNATFYFKGAPLAYTPYIEFPLVGERKSGFLTPIFGHQPEYWLRSHGALLLEHRAEPRLHVLPALHVGPGDPARQRGPLSGARLSGHRARRVPALRSKARDRPLGILVAAQPDVLAGVDRLRGPAARVGQHLLPGSFQSRRPHVPGQPSVRSVGALRVGLVERARTGADVANPAGSRRSGGAAVSATAADCLLRHAAGCGFGRGRERRRQLQLLFRAPE